MADFDKELDASGLNCPLPILRAKKAKILDGSLHLKKNNYANILAEISA